jgi:sugar (pentulose or hexulose) kinase
MARYASLYHAPLAGIGLDTWGVDFGLFDKTGRLLGNPVHYRDARTNGMVEHAFTRIAPREEIFATTGLQFLQLNTLIQLLSMRVQQDPQLDMAARLLMMPDIFHYWLTGEQVAEYTIASTSQMLRRRTAPGRGSAGALCAAHRHPTRKSSCRAPWSARCWMRCARKWGCRRRFRSSPWPPTTRAARWRAFLDWTRAAST